MLASAERKSSIQVPASPPRSSVAHRDCSAARQRRRPRLLFVLRTTRRVERTHARTHYRSLSLPAETWSRKTWFEACGRAKLHLCPLLTDCLPACARERETCNDGAAVTPPPSPPRPPVRPGHFTTAVIVNQSLSLVLLRRHSVRPHIYVCQACAFETSRPPDLLALPAQTARPGKDLPARTTTCIPTASESAHAVSCAVAQTPA